MDAKVLFRNEGNGLYTRAQLSEIERVIHAFYNYLRDSRTCELVWSDKVGYLFFTISGGRRHIPTDPRVIRSAGDLVCALLEGISRDIAAETRKKRFSRKEHPEFRRRIGDYMGQLPEYQSCVAAALRAG